MDEDRIPSEYDADDVEGHKIQHLHHHADADEADDVEGHRIQHLHHHADADDEDVEGHRVQAASPAVHDDGTGEGIASL